MDEQEEIDGGGPDQVPVLDATESNLGLPGEHHSDQQENEDEGGFRGRGFHILGWPHGGDQQANDYSAGQKIPKTSHRVEHGPGRPQCVFC